MTRCHLTYGKESRISPYLISSNKELHGKECRPNVHCLTFHYSLSPFHKIPLLTRNTRQLPENFPFTTSSD